MLLLIASALAGEIAVHGSENARLRFWNVPDTLIGVEDIHFADCPSEWFNPDYCAGNPTHVLDYQEVVERLNLSLGYKGWTLSLQGDAVALISNRYELDGEILNERELYAEGMRAPSDNLLLVPEKVSLDGNAGPIHLTIGDSYTSFGRGLALNLVKNTDVDVDTSLRGLNVSYANPHWQVSALTALTNPQQVAMEFPNEGIERNDGHAISALRLEHYGPKSATIGAQGVLVQYHPQSEWDQPFSAYSQSPGAMVGGATLNLTGKSWDSFVEGDVFHYNDIGIPTDTGYALYGSGGYYGGFGSLLLELKRTKNTEYINTYSGAHGYEIAAGPTLEYERVITEDSTAAMNSNDLWGAKLRSDIIVPSSSSTSLAPYVSLAVFRDHDLGGLHFNSTPETIFHPLAGFVLVAGHFDARLNTGFRMDIRDDAGNEDFGHDHLIHGDGEISVPMGEHLSAALSLSAQQFSWGVNVPQQSDFFESANALAIHIGEPWAVIGYLEYSDNPLVASIGNLDDDLYGALELQWKPTGSSTLKAFYGAYRAGIHCAGGQCRYLPGFEGAKLSFDMTF